MMQWMVTGTDTDAGKTFITGMLAAVGVARGASVGVVKPVASGAEFDKDGVPYSGDARFLMEMAGLGPEERESVNPYCLIDAVAPDLAAARAGVTVDVAHIEEVCRRSARRYELSFVEGAGGLTTGIAPNYTMTTLAQQLSLPLILVSDARLGSIHRVVTSVYWASGHGLQTVGIILNRVDEADPTLVATNAETMTARTGVPVIGMVPTFEGELTPEKLAQFGERCIAWEKWRME